MSENRPGEKTTGIELRCLHEDETLWDRKIQVSGVQASALREEEQPAPGSLYALNSRNLS